MLNQKDILQTQDMIDKRHLDIRTITMGISLLDCCDPDLKTCCDKIYRKITRCAKDLVKVGEDIEKEFGIPIVNKRISVTPISIVAGSCETDSYVEIAKTLDAAAITCGVNFIGGFSALVQKGCTTGDWKLIRSIPEAMAATERVCASVNVGSTKAGIAMDAVAEMGRIIKKTELTAITATRLRQGGGVPLTPWRITFMAGAFHGVGGAECVLNVGVSAPAWCTMPCRT